MTDVHFLVGSVSVGAHLCPLLQPLPKLSVRIAVSTLFTSSSFL